MICSLKDLKKIIQGPKKPKEDDLIPVQEKKEEEVPCTCNSCKIQKK